MQRYGESVRSPGSVPPKSVRSRDTARTMSQKDAGAAPDARRQIKLGGVGLASFGLIAVAAFVAPLWDVPGTQAGGADIIEHVGSHRDEFITALTLYALGMGLFVVFSTGLWIWLRRAGGDETSLAVFGVGCALLTALVLAGFVPMLVLAYRVGDLDAGTAQVLYDLCFGLLAISGVPTAFGMLGFAALVFRRQLLPRITAWVAVAAAVTHLVIAASFIPDSGFFSLEGGVIVAIPSTLFAWLLATSISLIWRFRSSPPGAS